MNGRLWICCQLGAREHYAIPRALHKNGKLHLLITDAWVKPNSIFKKLPVASFKKLGDRYHPDLEKANIKSFTVNLIKFEIEQRLTNNSDAWSTMISRNSWFQKKVIQALEKIDFSKEQYPTLFTYSYAALDILKYAKSRNWQVILGQIDPGIQEEKIVKAEKEKYPDLASSWSPVPTSYWEHWLEECSLADQIIVNSLWSKRLLEMVNIQSSKIKTVPLLYEASLSNSEFIRTYPMKFTQQRPLKVLFLGLVSIRKGISVCLDVIRELTGQPIEFFFVGPIQANIPSQIMKHPQVFFVGSVPRSSTEHYYQSSDVFLFPTLSDGFGLTQLEALAWKLPAIVSQNCGSVFRDKVTGFVLKENTYKEIVKILLRVLSEPKILEEMSSRISSESQKYNLNRFDFDLL